MKTTPEAHELITIQVVAHNHAGAKAISKALYAPWKLDGISAVSIYRGSSARIVKATVDQKIKVEFHQLYDQNLSTVGPASPKVMVVDVHYSPGEKHLHVSSGNSDLQIDFQYKREACHLLLEYLRNQASSLVS